MIAQAFYSHLNSDPALSKLINGISPHVIPQGKDAPWITYAIDDEEQQSLLAGQSGAYRTTTFDVNCWATKYDDALAIETAVRARLIDHVGPMGTTSPAVIVDHVRLERRLPDGYETDTNLRRISLQFVVGH